MKKEKKEKEKKRKSSQRHMTLQLKPGSNSWGGKRKKERKKTITKIHDLANETRVEIVEAGCGCDALHG